MAYLRILLTFFYNVYSKNKIVLKIGFGIEGELLLKKDVVKDLGIIFNTKLDFEDHIDYAVNKSLRKLLFVLRQSEVFRYPWTVAFLYESLAVPSLLYASAVWRPFLNVHLSRVERVQHLFLRSLAARVNNPMSVFQHACAPIMEQFNLLSCYDLMKYNNLVFLFKTFNNLINSLELVVAWYKSSCKKYTKKLIKQVKRQKLRLSFVLQTSFISHNDSYKMGLNNFDGSLLPVFPHQR